MRRSATDTLMAAMEEVDKVDECLVIMTDTEGDIITLGTTDKFTTRLGLIEMAKSLILKDIVVRHEES